MAQQNKRYKRIDQSKKAEAYRPAGSRKESFEITKYDVTHHSVEIKDNYDELKEKKLR